MAVTIICAVIGSGALSTIISAIISFATKRKEKDDAVQLLLYHTIKVECMEFIQRGSISADEYEVLTKMHKVYHDRGGNGYLDKLMTDTSKLPVVG